MADVRKVLERLDEDKVMKLLTMSGLDANAVKACTYTSWKDGIDIERASFGLMNFVHLIVREALSTLSNEQVGEKEMAEAIRSHFKEMGMQVVVSSDGIERVYYSGFSLVSLARAILSRLSLRSGVGEGWRPIESAPKEQRVLVYGNGGIMIAFQDAEGNWRQRHQGPYRGTPTCWMFLPTTPSDQKKTHVQELMDSRAPGDMPSPLEFREAFDADQKKG